MLGWSANLELIAYKVDYLHIYIYIYIYINPSVKKHVVVYDGMTRQFSL